MKKKAEGAPKADNVLKAADLNGAESLRSWALAVVAAAQQPRDGDRSQRANAARQVVEQGVMALRGLWKQGASPDPAGAVYLDALLESLELIAGGCDPLSALHLDAGGRVADANDYMRDLALFIEVGRALDAARARGAKRAAFGEGVGAIEQAKNAVAALHDRAAVDAAWKRFGRESGWADMKAGARGKPRPRKP
jgi:hypothetical protein